MTNNFLNDIFIKANVLVNKINFLLNTSTLKIRERMNTKNIIIQKFFELAQEKNIDKITVQDIAYACKITRQSFYYHFQDIRAIIEYVLEDYLQNLLKKSEAFSNINEALKDFVESIGNYSNIINALMRSNGFSQQYEKLLNSTLQEYIKGIVDQKNLFHELTFSELKTVINFYSYALSGILIEYSGKKTFDSEKLVKHLHRIFTGKIKFQFPI